MSLTDKYLSRISTKLKIRHHFFPYISHIDKTNSNSMQEVCHIYLNLVIWPKLPRVSCSSVVECQPGVRKVMGLTPVGGTQNYFSE